MPNFNELYSNSLNRLQRLEEIYRSIPSHETSAKVHISNAITSTVSEMIDLLDNKKSKSKMKRKNQKQNIINFTFDMLTLSN